MHQQKAAQEEEARKETEAVRVLGREVPIGTRDSTGARGWLPQGEPM